MSLTKVLNIIGDDNIEYQNVENSAVRMKVNKKYGDCEITFTTGHDLLNGCGKTGLVVWVDSGKLTDAVSQVNNQKE